jgi:hypothetical protein
MPGKNSTNAINLTPEELEKALDVKPPLDPQNLEDHVHQLLMRAQVSWLSKRDVLDILTNWQIYNLPISLMPPDQPGRTFLNCCCVFALPTSMYLRTRRVRAPSTCTRVNARRPREQCSPASELAPERHTTVSQ